MARTVRREKRVKGKRTRIIEVLSDTKRDVKKKEPERERKVTKLAPIEAKKKPSFIQRFAKTKVGKVLTSLKTTAVLGATLAGGAGLAARAGAAGLAAGRTAVISRTAFQGTRTKFRQRAFTGQGTRKSLERLFRTKPRVAPVAARFAGNSKSQGLSTSMVSKLGLSVGAAGIFVGAVGSYPFAGFIKEEAIQTLGFAFNTAERNNDVVGMENALANVEEILNNEQSIMDKLPYVNVIIQLRSFFEAAQTKLDNDRRRLESLRAEAETGETAFEAERAEARQTQLEQRERDAEYFALIREGKFEEAEELLQEELKGGR